MMQIHIPNKRQGFHRNQQITSKMQIFKQTMLHYDLMNGVENENDGVHANDSGALQASISRKEEICSSLVIMLMQEKSTYACGDYIYDRIAKRNPLTYPSTTGIRQSRQTVDESCREQICEWCYRVTEYFSFDREVVYIAMSYLDRLLMSCQVDRHTYRLAAATSLLLALKVHHPLKIVLADFVSDLSKGAFLATDLVRMEIVMLRVLSWRIHPPTAMSYIVRILLLNSTQSRLITESDINSIQDYAIFFAELSVRDYNFVTLGQSVVALSSLLNAMEGLGMWSASRTDDCNERQSVCEFVSKVCKLLDLNHDDEVVIGARLQLWRLYERSEQYTRNDFTKRVIPKSFYISEQFRSKSSSNATRLMGSPKSVSTPQII